MAVIKLRFGTIRVVATSYTSITMPTQTSQAFSMSRLLPPSPKWMKLLLVFCSEECTNPMTTQVHIDNLDRRTIVESSNRTCSTRQTSFARCLLFVAKLCQLHSVINQLLTYLRSWNINYKYCKGWQKHCSQSCAHRDYVCILIAQNCRQIFTLYD